MNSLTSSSSSSNRLLSRLLNGSETSKLIIIEDSVSCSGRHLMRCFLKNRNSSDKMAIIVLENDAKCYNSIPNITVYDNFNEISDNLLNDAIESLSINHSLVAIDSLSLPLMIDNVRHVCCAIDLLCKKYANVICLVHYDSHSQYIINSIESTASTVIKLSRNASPKCYKSTIIHKKPHRRTTFSLIHENELFNIKDFRIDYVTLINRDANVSTAVYDPISNLPFNLNLKDDELEAKNSLVLPYTKAQNTSKVYYEHDKGDDVDEEDPDDDLDI